jgi:hypothetical protein
MTITSAGYLARMSRRYATPRHGVLDRGSRRVEIESPPVAGHFRFADGWKIQQQVPKRLVGFLAQRNAHGFRMARSSASF